MCCFSQEVGHVSGTEIFARLANGNQYLVYQMKLSSAKDMAMILPIPVKAGAGEDAITFISMEDFPGFFNWMSRYFPDSTWGDLALDDSVSASAPVLEVHEVGCYEASFVPGIHDFCRLDERYRLPEGIWDNLSFYRDYGFVVFKLGPGKDQQLHPMAFSFPTRMSNTLFFPTIHVHDGQYYETASFDHILYCQSDHKLDEWMESWDSFGNLWVEQMDFINKENIIDEKPSETFQPGGAIFNILNSERCGYKKVLKGSYPNQDILVNSQSSH